MEVNVKEEQVKVEAEIAQLSKHLSQVKNQINLLQQEGQELINALVEKSGEQKLLQRLNGKKEGKGEKTA